MNQVEQRCLFCGNRTFQKGLVLPSRVIPNLESLCSYLDFRIPDSENAEKLGLFKNLQPYFNGTKSISSQVGKGCSPILCRHCGGNTSYLVESLRQMEEIKKRVEETRREIRQIILKENAEVAGEARKMSGEDWLGKMLRRLLLNGVNNEGDDGEGGSIFEEQPVLIRVIIPRPEESKDPLSVKDEVIEISSDEEEEKEEEGEWEGEDFTLNENNDVDNVEYEDSSHSTQASSHHFPTTFTTLPDEQQIGMFKCEECGASSFNSREDFIKHLACHNGNQRVFCCKSCPVVYYTLDDLLDHIVTSHASLVRFDCPQCSSIFPSFHHLYVHCVDCHSEFMKKFPCRICGKVYRKRVGLSLHEKICSKTQVRNHAPKSSSSEHSEILQYGGSYKCALCPNKVFKSLPNIKNHLKIFHTSDEQKRFQCPHCSKGFVHHITLKNHVEQIHEKIRYYCNQCPKSFTSKVILKSHQKLHINGQPAKVTCPVCQKDYSCEPSLKNHMKAVHETNQPETCELCGKEFVNVFNLRAHLISVHKIRKRKSGEAKPGKTGEEH